MTKIIANEGYQEKPFLFEYGIGEKIYLKNKNYFFDLSNCAGSLILGHNSQIFRNSINSYLKKNISVFAHPNTHADDFSKTIKKFFPNFSKIIFCNSGTEAVVKSLRLNK